MSPTTCMPQPALTRSHPRLLIVPAARGRPNMRNAEKGVAGNGAKNNGVNGAFGNVNLMQGLTCQIEMCFLETGTDTLATLEMFYMSYYDFDLGTGETGEAEPKAEKLSVYQHNHFFLNTAGDIQDDPDDPGTLCTVRQCISSAPRIQSPSPAAPRIQSPCPAAPRNGPSAPDA